jgi:hypothetical protein
MRHLNDNGLPIPILLHPTRGVIGLRLELVMVDILHCLDLGVASSLVGSALWFFVIIKSCLGGGPMAQKAKRLHTNLRQWYNKTRCQYRLQGELTVERLRKKPSEWVKLRAKGAQTRRLAFYALELALMHASDDVVDNTIVECLRLLVRVYQIMENESQFLAATAKEELRHVGDGLGMAYSSLATHFLNLNPPVKLFKTAPKLHMLQHLLIYQASEWGNPRFYHTYPDEDLVGAFVEICNTVHPNTMAVTALYKWLILFFTTD